MTRQIPISNRLNLCVALLLGGIGCVLPLEAPATEPGSAVSAIRAQLFYEWTGKLSKDVLSDDDYSFWNVVIGDESSQGGSHSTLVVVELSASPGATDPDHKLSFEARYSVGEIGPDGQPRLRKIVVSESRVVESFGPTGKKYFGFWLSETGCIPVDLKATVLPGGKPSKVTIPFNCGE